MALMPPPVTINKDALDQQAAAMQPWSNMSYLLQNSPYVSRFGQTGSGFSMGGPGSDWYNNTWTRYNPTADQFLYGLGTGAISGQSQNTTGGAKDWFSVADPTAWQNILGQQGGFDWTQATADPSQIGNYLLNQTQLLGGGMTPSLNQLYNQQQTQMTGGQTGWNPNPLYQSQNIENFYKMLGYSGVPQAQNQGTPYTGQATGMEGITTGQQYKDAWAAHYAQQQAAEQGQTGEPPTAPVTQTAQQLGQQVPTSATGPDGSGNYQYTNPYSQGANYNLGGGYANQIASYGAGNDFMPGEDQPWGDWYPGMPGSDPNDPYGGWGWDPWIPWPPDWRGGGGGGGGTPPPSGGGGPTPGTGGAGDNWGNFNPVDEMYYPQTGFGPPQNFGGWDPWGGPDSHTFGPAVGNMNYNLVQGMNQMMPQWMNPYPQMNQAYGSFFTDYAQQYPDMFSNYLGGLQGLVAGGPYAQAFDPNSALHQAFSYMSPGSVGMAGLENARMAAGMPTTAQGANAGLYQMLQQAASGNYNPATEGGGQYQDMMNRIMGGSGQPGQLGYMDWLSSIANMGIPNQSLMEQAGNEAINQFRNVGDIMNTGATDWLQSIFQLGPPGQSMDISDREGIEGLQGAMTNLGRSGTSEAQDRLLQMLAGGGLTPEYVSAMQQQVLEPAQTQLAGKLNQMAGGKANLGTSGTSEWYNERLAKDFADNLTRTGFENYSNALQQMGGLGMFGAQQAPNIASQLMNNAMQPLGMANQMAGTAGQNAMGMFGSVPQAVHPFLQTGINAAQGFGGMGQQGGISNAQLQQQLLGMGNQQAMGWDQQNLAALQGLLGAGGSAYGQNLQGMGLFGQMMNQPFYGGQSFLGQQQQTGQGWGGEMGALLRTLMSGQTQENIAKGGQSNYWDFINAVMQNWPKD